MYPALGGDCPRNFVLASTQALAANVTGITGFQDNGFKKRDRNLTLNNLQNSSTTYSCLLPINIKAITPFHTTWAIMKIANHAIICSNQIKIPKQGHLMVVKNAYK
jgi:hypothetical protein